MKKHKFDDDAIIDFLIKNQTDLNERLKVVEKWNEGFVDWSKIKRKKGGDK